MDYLKKIYEVIQTYYEQEFDYYKEIYEIAMESNNIGLLCTEYEKEILEVIMNLEDLTINYYKNGEIINQDKFNTLVELYENIKHGLDYYELLYECQGEYYD